MGNLESAQIFLADFSTFVPVFNLKRHEATLKDSIFFNLIRRWTDSENAE
jgi:hypothetical protein